MSKASVLEPCCASDHLCERHQASLTDALPHRSDPVDLPLAEAPTARRERGRPRKWDARSMPPVPAHAVCFDTRSFNQHQQHCIGNARDEDNVERIASHPQAFGIECDPETAWCFIDDMERFLYHDGRIPAKWHALSGGTRIVEIPSQLSESEEVADELDLWDVNEHED